MAQVTIKGALDFSAVNNSETTTTASSSAAAVVTDTAAPGNNGWSTSQLGISVAEDLGNGLKATATINTGLKGGGSNFADRDRFIGLSGGFGSVRLGRFTPATDGANGFYAGTSNVSGTGDSLSTPKAGGSHGRQTAMQYSTPNINGLVGNVVYGSGKVDIAGTEGKAGTKLQGLSLSYTQGPLSLGAGTSTLTTNVEAAASTAGFCLLSATATSTQLVAAGTACAANTRITGTDAVSASETKSKQQYVGASYNLGVATLVANYKTGVVSAAGVNSADIKLTTFGVTIPMGAVTLAANMYSGENAGAAASATDNLDLKGNQISARYALSKRTFVYAAQGRDETNRAAGNTTGATSKTTKTSMGLVHSF